MLKIKYYIKKLNKRLSSIFSVKRLKKYGVRMAIIDFFIFIMHRNNSGFEHYLIRQKDLIVQKYIYKNYDNIINEIRMNCD